MNGLHVPTPTSAFHAALRTVDNLLEYASLTAQAVNRSWGPLPKTTEDFNEAEPTSKIAAGIEAVRAQIKRGLPITASPESAIVSCPAFPLAVKTDLYGFFFLGVE